MLYKVEELIGDQWFCRLSIRSSLKECTDFINENQRHYPSKTYRIIKLTEEVDTMFVGKPSSAPMKRVIYCANCQKKIIEKKDELWYCLKRPDDFDVYCCSKECALEDIQNHYLKVLKPDHPDYRWVDSWIFDDEED